MFLFIDQNCLLFKFIAVFQGVLSVRDIIPIYICDCVDNNISFMKEFKQRVISSFSQRDNISFIYSRNFNKSVFSCWCTFIIYNKPKSINMIEKLHNLRFSSTLFTSDEKNWIDIYVNLHLIESLEFRWDILTKESSTERWLIQAIHRHLLRVNINDIVEC